MDITWLGHSAVRIRGSQLVIVADPYDSSIGAEMPKVKADIVSVSHDHPHHSYVEAVEGSPRVLSTPGEYEIGNFYISGMATARYPKPAVKEAETDDEDTEPEATNWNRQINTVYTFRSEGLTICHLGAIGQTLSARQTEELNQADVLIIPVGGNSTIDIGRAAQLVSAIGPRIVVPVHYRINGIDEDQEPADRFLGEVGAADITPQTRLNVSLTNLPRDMTVAVLQVSS
jgi:L-ascorbate metabolism protein UlaG (beta-lactamase superfamily)